MASQSQQDPVLCRRYAQFASPLEPWQVEVMYWTLFVSNIIILFLASWVYITGQTALERHASRTDQRARKLRTCIFLCLACVVASTLIVVMETYALLALQFCEGEDLIMLYWSTWTMTQVGSLVAMLGIVLALSHSLHGSKHPPWALALGTPVLVLAGVLHFLHESAKKGVTKLRRRPSVDSSDGPPMSQETTIEASPSPSDEDGSDMHAELIGLTVEGRPVVRFLGPVPMVPGHGEILRFSSDKEPIVAFRGGIITVKSESKPTKQ